MLLLLNDTLINTDTNCIGEGANAIEIESQSMAVLTFLSRHAGELVTRDMLLQSVWQGRVVTDNSLHRVIGLLRKALGDDSSNPRFIKTIHGKGYVLTAEVQKPKQKYRSLLIGVVGLVCLLLFSSLMLNWNIERPEIAFVPLGNATSLPGVEYRPVIAKDGSGTLFIHTTSPGANSSRLMLNTPELESAVQVYEFSGQVNAMAWSNDKRQVAMAIQNQERCQVYLLQLDVKLTVSADNHFAPQFSCIPYAPIQLEWSVNGETLYVLNTPSSEVFAPRLYQFKLFDKELIELPITSLDEIHGFARAATSNKLVLFRVIDEQMSEVWLYQPKKGATKITELPLEVDQIDWGPTGHQWIVLANDRLYSLDGDGAVDEVKDSFRLGMQDLDTSMVNNVVYSAGTSRQNLYEWDLEKMAGATAYQPSSMNQAAASYNPQGNTVAFLSDRRGRGWELWLSNQDGLTPVELKGHQLALSTPSWRPDGSGLMLLSNKYQLLYLDLAEKSLKEISDSQDLVLAGSWLNDNSILYSKEVDGQFQMFLRDVATLDERQWTYEGGYYAQPSDDSRFLYFSKRNMPGLWRLNLKTGQNTQVYDEFGPDNYSRWQLVNGQIYFRQHTKLGIGVFKYDFAGEVQQLFQSNSAWLFHVSGHNNKIMLTEVEMAFSDIKTGRITTN